MSRPGLASPGFSKACGLLSPFVAAPSRAEAAIYAGVGAASTAHGKESRRPAECRSPPRAGARFADCPPTSRSSCGAHVLQQDCGRGRERAARLALGVFASRLLLPHVGGFGLHDLGSRKGGRPSRPANLYRPAPSTFCWGDFGRPVPCAAGPRRATRRRERWRCCRRRRNTACGPLLNWPGPRRGRASRTAAPSSARASWPRAQARRASSWKRFSSNCPAIRSSSAGAGSSAALPLARPASSQLRRSHPYHRRPAGPGSLRVAPPGIPKVRRLRKSRSLYAARGPA